MKENEVRELASLFEEVSKKHKLRPERLAAIARQESAYKLDAVNCYTAKGKKRCDYCMMQINDKTAENFGWDIELLTSDIKYCVEAGATVLKDFKKRYHKTEPDDFWTRYNSSHPEKREKYKRNVEKWL